MEKKYRNEHGVEIDVFCNDLAAFLLGPLENLENLFKMAQTTQFDDLETFSFLCSDYLEKIRESINYRLAELEKKIGKINVVEASYCQRVVKGGTILDYILTPVTASETTHEMEAPHV